MRKLVKRAILYVINKIIDSFDIYTLLLKKYAKSKRESNISKLRYIGEGVKLNGIVNISHPEFVMIGNNVHIGNNATISSAGGVIIGDNAHISRNLVIYSQNHNYKGKLLPYDNTTIDKPVHIGQNVWIGMNVCITPGVTIGEGAIIGMGATISKNVEPYSIVGSQPYKVLKKRDVEYYNKLKSNKKFSGVNGNILEQKDYKEGGLDGSNMFFVVSTGRSGSTSIAKILNQHSKVSCRHEPNSQLIRLSTEYEYGLVSREEVKEQIRNMYSVNGFFDKETIYGESDQKLSNLISILAEVLPKAKFLWIIRKPKDFIYSASRRGWYDSENPDKGRNEIEKQWIKYRLQGDLVGVINKGEWNKMTIFEKNAWYWSFWNEKIKEQLNNLDDNQSMIVNLEQIKIDSILSFLSLPNEPLSPIITNQGKRDRIIDKSEVNLSIKNYCSKEMLFFCD